MIWLSDLILTESKSDLISDMQAQFEYVSKKYFKEDHGKFKKPTFKVQSNLKTIGVYIPRDNLFKLNADFANDETALKSTIYHETIHYFQVHKFGFDKKKLSSDGYHDDYFKKLASKINSGEGSKLVTVAGTWQSIKSGKSVKPFWVYVVNDNTDIKWQWSPRKNEKLIVKLDRMKIHYKWDSLKVFQTDDIKFKEAPRSNGNRGVEFGMVRVGDELYKDINNAVKKHK